MAAGLVLGPELVPPTVPGHAYDSEDVTEHYYSSPTCKMGATFRPSDPAIHWAEGADGARGDEVTFSVTSFSSDTSGAKKSEL